MGPLILDDLGLVNLLPHILGAMNNYRFAMCPVCLATTDKPEDCIYTYHHECYPLCNERLLLKYGGRRAFNICSSCGRACRGHGHFQLTDPDDEGRPREVPPENFYGPDCRLSGGGARRELIARCLGIIQYINTLGAGPVRKDRAFITAATDAAERAAADDRMLRLADQSLLDQRFAIVCNPVHFIREGGGRRKTRRHSKSKKHSSRRH
jgi:hypothetical protein